MRLLVPLIVGGVVLAAATGWVLLRRGRTDRPVDTSVFDDLEDAAAAADTVEVSCPYCPESHRYALDVRRDSAYTLSVAQPLPQPRRSKRFRRVFTRPTTGRDFQATITLYETATSIIRSVDVIGPEK